MECYGLLLVFLENGYCNIDFVYFDGVVYDL